MPFIVENGGNGKGDRGYKKNALFPGEFTNSMEDVDTAMRVGFDSSNNGGNELYVFSPNQIKSATENTGQFSRGADIRYSEKKPPDNVTRDELMGFVQANAVEVGDKDQVSPDLSREYHELDRIYAAGLLSEEQSNRQYELRKVIEKAKEGQQTHISGMELIYDTVVAATGCGFCFLRPLYSGHNLVRRCAIIWHCLD